MGSIAAGTYYVLAEVDNGSVVTESNETNNVIVGNQVTVSAKISPPNLTPYQPSGWSDKIVVSNVTGTNTDSDPLYTTDNLYVDWAVTNNGAAATGAGFSQQPIRGREPEGNGYPWWR